MKVEKLKNEFEPVVITLENEFEYAHLIGVLEKCLGKWICDLPTWTNDFGELLLRKLNDLNN